LTDDGRLHQHDISLKTLSLRERIDPPLYPLDGDLVFPPAHLGKVIVKLYPEPRFGATAKGLRPQTAFRVLLSIRTRLRMVR
jgi:hypothetical protein